jgi:hypothetical protein
MAQADEGAPVIVFLGTINRETLFLECFLVSVQLDIVGPLVKSTSVRPSADPLAPCGSRKTDNSSVAMLESTYHRKD